VDVHHIVASGGPISAPGLFGGNRRIAGSRLDGLSTVCMSLAAHRTPLQILEGEFFVAITLFRLFFWRGLSAYVAGARALDGPGRTPNPLVVVLLDPSARLD